MRVGEQTLVQSGHCSVQTQSACLDGPVGSYYQMYPLLRRSFEAQQVMFNLHVHASGFFGNSLLDGYGVAVQWVAAYGSQTDGSGAGRQGGEQDVGGAW